MSFELLFICSFNARLKVAYASFKLSALLCSAIPVTTANMTYKSLYGNMAH